MASIKLNPLVTSISGSIGNATIQRNASGVTIRQKPININPRSVAQLTRRIQIRQVQVAWQALTDTQKNYWLNFSNYYKAYCKKNPTVLLSGYQLFLSYNMLRLSAGLSILSDITFTITPFNDVSGTCIFHEDELGYNFENAFFIDEWLPLLKCSRPLIRRITPNSVKLRCIPINFMIDTEIEFTPGYLSIYGSLPAVGNFIAISIQFINKYMPVVQSPFLTIHEVSPI